MDPEITQECQCPVCGDPCDRLYFDPTLPDSGGCEACAAEAWLEEMQEHWQAVLDAY